MITSRVQIRLSQTPSDLTEHPWANHDTVTSRSDSIHSRRASMCQPSSRPDHAEHPCANHDNVQIRLHPFTQSTHVPTRTNLVEPALLEPLKPSWRLSLCSISLDPIALCKLFAPFTLIIWIGLVLILMSSSTTKSLGRFWELAKKDTRMYRAERCLK